MTQIHDLVPDIYKFLSEKGTTFSEEIATNLAESLTKRFQERVKDEGERRTLRLSQMRPWCPCALWYSVNKPEEGEKLPPWAQFKFAYGDIIEAFVITLAKAVGHDVKGEQDHVELDGIVGHRDCVIDGCIVDVKSSASRSFLKFKDKSLSTSDTFGYLDQLDGYIISSRLDPLVTNKDRGYLVAVDKQLGHMCLYEHEVTHEREEALRARIREYKAVVNRETPPPCNCRHIPYGASGNMQLDVLAGYSPYKYCCNPRLRTFLYSTGPVFLTKVIRKPDVPEIDRYGNKIY